LDPTIALRLLLVYVHLLLCVFALYTVLNTDWRLLRSRISAKHLLQSHRRVVWLLAGLWISGLAIVSVDGLGQMGSNPKLQAKVVCVSLLTFNGLLLRYWCFPRLVSNRPLKRLESWALMSCGAVSTTCWMLSAFYGIAKPLALWTPAQNLLLLWAALAVAIPVALSLAGRLREGRRLRQQDSQASLPARGKARADAPQEILTALRERPNAAMPSRDSKAVASRLPSL
jgi:hypothetical protein